MPEEKKYKALYNADYMQIGEIYTFPQLSDKVIKHLIDKGNIKEIQTEKQYWLGSRRMFKCGDVWKHITDEIIIQDELFQLLVREGIITEQEVEVGD